MRAAGVSVARPGRLAAAGLFASLVLGLSSAPAAAHDVPLDATGHIYWANESGDAIARADLDGGSVEPGFITGAEAPRGVALSPGFVYWAHDGAGGTNPAIGRAELPDASAPDQAFIPTDDPPAGLGTDHGRIFWTQTISGTGWVARASLAGFGVNQTLVETAGPPCGVASDGDEVYWANGGAPGSIGSAHGGPPADQSLITDTDDPCGVARAGAYIYWTNRAGDSIGRAKLDGSEPDPDFIELSAGASPCGVAVDGAHIYWTAAAAIGRAEIDGSDPDEALITDVGAVQGPCGLAVTPSQTATPDARVFAATTLGSNDIHAFTVENTSSSPLDVTGTLLFGAAPEQFQITGDGCTPNVTPPGLNCLINVVFRPSRSGNHTAVLRVTSNASNSRIEIPLSGTGLAPPASLPPAPPAPPNPKCAKLRKKMKRLKRARPKKGRKAVKRRLHRRLRRLEC